MRLAVLGCVAMVGMLFASSASAQERLRLVATVGVLDGPGPDVFGSVDAVAARPNGDFFVLDGQSKRIVGFDSEGQLLAVAGRAGGGPGEFMEPRTIAVVGEGLVVLDAGNARLDFFEAERSEISHRSSVPYFLGGRSLCSLGERLYTGTSRDGLMIHEVSGAGRPVKSFGQVSAVQGVDHLGPFRQMVEGMLTGGIIACVEDAEVIVLAPTAQPFVAAFGGDGAELWSTALTDYGQIEYETVPAGGVRASFASEQGAHIAQSVVRWSDRAILVQYELRGFGGRPRDSEPVFESRIFDLRSGLEIERRRDLPLIVASAGSVFYGVRTSPHPQVLLLER